MADPAPTDNKVREFLALTVSLVSLAGVIALGIAVIWKDQQNGPAKDVLTIVLPLFGTWVGTVLAFYFSKENFESAARSVSNMAKEISAKGNLKSIGVRDKMIPRDSMFFKVLPIDQIKISDLIAELEKKNKGDRIPVLTANNLPKYIIHRSMLDKFLADSARGAGGQNVSTLTMGDLFKAQPDLEKLFATSFATVKADATLDDAKTAMEQTKHCEDVFVTADGSPNTEVLGWITDNIIQANLQA